MRKDDGMESYGGCTRQKHARASRYNGCNKRARRTVKLNLQQGSELVVSNHSRLNH